VYSVYILRCADGTLYTGIALDIAERLAKHRAGKGAKYTRGRLPVRLVYKETGHTQSSALRREIFIKNLNKVQKRELINSQMQQ